MRLKNKVLVDLKLLCSSNYFIAGFYLIVGLFIYFTSFNDGFVLDDIQQIVNHASVHDLSRWADHFFSSTMANPSGVSGIYYKPLMMLSYSFLWKLGGGMPYSFHLFQFILHCVNSFLIYTLFNYFFKNEKSFGFLAGLIFLVHPLNSEAILHSADLQEPLYTFFGLLILMSLIKIKKSLNSMILIFFLMLASLFSKESGILYLATGISYCFIFEKQKMKPYILTAFLGLSTYFYFRFGLAHLTSLKHESTLIAQSDFATRMQTIPKIIIHYIHLFFYPDQISLTQDWVVSNLTFNDFWIPLLEVLFLTGLIFYFMQIYKDKLFLFFLSWIILGFSIHLQIIPLDGTVSDRWVYFPMIGALGLIFIGLQKSQLNRKKIFVTLGLIVIGLSVRSYYRTLNWQTPYALFEHDVKIDPGSAYLNNNFGLELFFRGEYEKAKPYFLKTLHVAKKESFAWNTANMNLAAVYLFAKDYVLAEQFSQMLLPTKDPKVYRIYSWSLFGQNRKAELRQFLKTQALPLFPQDFNLKDLERYLDSNP